MPAVRRAGFCGPAALRRCKTSLSVSVTGAKRDPTWQPRQAAFMKHLLVVQHSKTGATRALIEAAMDGMRDPAIAGVEYRLLAALEASPEDVRWADALLLGTPENFGYMSGALKHFFDSIYYECLDHTQGLPYALIVKAGNDGRGAVRAIERIVSGLAWRGVADPLVVRGEITGDAREAARELGMTLAAGLEAGVF